MSKISKEGFEQIQIIRNALDSMFDKLDSNGQFPNVQEEFEAIAGIVQQVNEWQEVG